MAFENLTGTGSTAHYGVRDTNQKFGGVVSDGAGGKKAIWTFDYDDLPAKGTDTNQMQVYVPSYATMTECRFTVLTAFTGGTDYNVGTEQLDGTDIDLDGLFDALLITDIDARGQVINATNHAGTNSGLLLAGAAANYASTITMAPSFVSASGLVNSAFDQYLTVTANGTFTAGRATIEIFYTEERV
jgi:hypothetical protein